MVIFGETVTDLQNSLNNLKVYCDTWGLTVNTLKTKVMVFRKRGQSQPNEQWTYGDENIELVDEFSYLGVLLRYNGLFKQHQQLVCGKALKAMGALFNNTNEFHFKPKVMCQLFDAFVGSTLNYGSEIAGFCSQKEVERLHLRFCKRILGVKLSSSNLAVYGELGRFPLSISKYIRILKYWFKILNTENCIIKGVYTCLMDDLDNGKMNWAGNVRTMLCENGFQYVWENPLCVQEKYFVNLFRQRLIDSFVQKWNGELRESRVLHIV